MCENNQDQNNQGNASNQPNIADELGKLFKLGVGAVADVVERGKNFVEELTTEGTEANAKANKLREDLTRKGEEALNKTVDFGGDIVNKVKEAMHGLPLDVDHIRDLASEFTSEQLTELRAKIDELLKGREEAGSQEAGSDEDNQDTQN